MYKDKSRDLLEVLTPIDNFNIIFAILRTGELTHITAMQNAFIKAISCFDNEALKLVPTVLSPEEKVFFEGAIGFSVYNKNNPLHWRFVQIASRYKLLKELAT